MQLKKLDQSFYTNNTHLVEALDNFNGHWQSGKVRGYGVVLIDLSGLTFAIPLRSNIKHKAAYLTVKRFPNGTKGKGLDFSKAVLISQSSYISSTPFKIPPNEYKKLQNKEIHITKKFEKYVDHYIKAIKLADQNILKSAEYRYSTLKNYHASLNTIDLSEK
jgi:protein AbiQ